MWCAQSALKTRACDLKGVPTGDGIFVVFQFAPQLTSHERNLVDVHSGGLASRGIDGHAENATIEFKVVELEGEVRQNGRDHGGDSLDDAAGHMTHLPPKLALTEQKARGVPVPQVHRTSKDGLNHSPEN